MTKNSTTLKLVTCGVMLGLATVLSFIKVFELPLGGSVTLLSMLPICIISLKYGLKWGFTTSILYAVIQIAAGLSSLMTWGMDLRMWIGSLVFDYVIAFGILGIAGIFRKKGLVGILGGVTLALFLRFASHLVSGTIFFDVWMPAEFSNPFVYSIFYNGSYMLPELIVTIIASVILFKVPAVAKLLTEE